MNSIRTNGNGDIYTIIHKQQGAAGASHPPHFLSQPQQRSGVKISFSELNGVKTGAQHLLNQRNKRATAGLMTIGDKIEGEINAGHWGSSEL